MSIRVDPPGARSCRYFLEDAGSSIPNTELSPPYRWEYAPSFSQRLLATTGTKFSYSNTFNKFRLKFDRAEKGRLTYGSGQHRDVWKMSCAPDILEIKYKNLPPDYEAEKYWFRVYFSEPRSKPGILVALSLCLKKADDSQGQTSDAKNAEKELYKYLSKELK